jgi:uncharacterized damage-inducible protein DinB
MTKKLALTVIGLLALSPALAQAQVVSSLAALHGITQEAVTATADLVSEELYSFQPTEEVRSMGQLLGHIADSNYSICSTASGRTNPSAESIEQTKTSKADIQAALASAFAFCQDVYTNTTDAQGAEMVPFFGGQQMARSGVLAFNSGHTYEHYGNLVTYMRLNGITPPTSMPQ